MKAKVIVSLFCIVQFLYTGAQFNWSNPQPSGYSNENVIFTDPATGYIINSNGDLIKTANSGNSWKIQRNFPYCAAMDALDSVFVIGGADTVVYVSTDKAQTWRASILRQNQATNKIVVVSKDTIFAVSTNASLGNTALFQSVDRGLTWQPVNSSLIIKSIDFIDSKLGYATSFGGIFKTVDGGKTWQNVYVQPTGYSFTSIKFLDRNTGYASQDFGQLVKTTDGGATWSVSIAHLTARIYSISFAAATTVFIAGEDGYAARSTDNGVTWADKVPDHFGYGYHIYAMRFLNANTGFVVGHRGRILKTTDGGNTYQQYAPTYIDIQPISFPTAGTGYAASWNNLIKTTDSGQTWNTLSFSLSNTANRFQKLYFFSKDTGIALAETPVQVYKTYNGGQSWQTLALPILYKDNVLGFFAIKNTVYLSVSGAYGSSMLKSADRGETWRVLSLNISQADYRNLYFLDEKNGFASYGLGLYKTTDSAKTWKSVLNNATIISSLWFTDAAKGYVTAGDGYNQMTTDSGKTWTRMKILPDNVNFGDINAIRFFSSRVGYLVSADGGIYKTFNEGVTWRAEKPAPWDCKAIEMTADTSVYLAGTYGTILKKDMREYLIDTLKVIAEGSCAMRASAWVTAVLSTIDSVWFEYGTAGFTKSVAATPSRVADSSLKAETVLQELAGDSSYMLRVKTYYLGNYHYSQAVTFRFTGSLPKPVITLNGTVLSSSATSGNQWFLNNVLIPGATATTYQPATPGVYTVQQKQNGCTSAMSAEINYTTTAINDPVLTQAVRVFPNPVTAAVIIQNRESRKLRIMIADMWGRTWKTIQTAKIENTVDVQQLSAGVYTVVIEEINTHKTTRAGFVKL